MVIIAIFFVKLITAFSEKLPEQTEDRFRNMPIDEEESENKFQKVVGFQGNDEFYYYSIIIG